MTNQQKKFSIQPAGEPVCFNDLPAAEQQRIKRRLRYQTWRLSANRQPAPRPQTPYPEPWRP